VAIGAHHVTLSDLIQQVGAGLEHCPPSRQLERLEPGVSMVEVHLMGFERFAAVGAWAPT
jgi:hypothetical protein